MYVLEKKDYVSVSKTATCKRLCNLQEFFTAFTKKTPECKYWVLKVLWLETQMVCSGWLKNDSLGLRMKRSSKCCVSCRCNGQRLDIQRPDQIKFVSP